MTKTKRETDNARDTQYSIGHVPKRLLVRPTVANQLLRANQYEHACFGLPSPWSFPSRSDKLLHAVVLPWLSLCRDRFRHEKFRPLFCRPVPFPLVLGCDRPLVGVDAENFEVVQKTPHLFFFLLPRGTRPPPRVPRTITYQLP